MRTWNRWHVAAFVGPAMALFTLLLVIPILHAFGLSFTDASFATLQEGLTGVGLANYRELASDHSFWSAVALLLIFIATTTLLELLVALAVAYYLEQVLPVPRLLQTALLVPMFVIPVVSGLTFRYLLDPNDGVLGHLCALLGIIPPDMFGNPRLAFVSIVLQDVWRMWPFLFIILVAGFRALPRVLLEAASLDGASRWQTFWHVMLPILRPTLVVALMLKSVEALKAFTEIYVMTGGGPGDATSVLSMFIHNQAFGYFRLGYGSAASTLLLAAGTLLALGVLAFGRKREVA